MNLGLDILKKTIENHQMVIRVIIYQAKGSTPREIGATMLVWEDPIQGLRTWGSIGGGYLEDKAIEISRLSIQGLYPKVYSQHFILGYELDQCCGGTVSLVWEKFEKNQDIEWLNYFYKNDYPFQRELNLQTGISAIKKSILMELESNLSNHIMGTSIILDSDDDVLREIFFKNATEITIFGAGHVARYLLKYLTDFGYKIDVYDSRDVILGKSLFDYQKEFPLVNFYFQKDFLSILDCSSNKKSYLVMTHSHQLDFLICQKILRMNQFNFLGLIGSKTKSARFKSRFSKDGISNEIVSKLQCPIGKKSSTAKIPAAIAMEIALEVLDSHKAISNTLVTSHQHFSTNLEINE